MLQCVYQAQSEEFLAELEKIQDTKDEPLSHSDIAEMRKLYLRPTETIRQNIWFTCYWAWLFWWDHFPVQTVCVLCVLSLLASANFYHLIKMVVFG